MKKFDFEIYYLNYFPARTHEIYTDHAMFLMGIRR